MPGRPPQVANTGSVGSRAASPPSCWRRHLPPTVLAWLPCPVPPAGICSRALDPVAVSGNKLGIGSRRQLRGLPDHSWHVASAQADPNPVEPPADGSTLICFARHAITRPRSTSRHPLDLTPVPKRIFVCTSIPECPRRCVARWRQVPKGQETHRPTNASWWAFSSQDAHGDALGGPRLVDATLPLATPTRALGQTGRHPCPDPSPAWSRIARTSPCRT